MRAEPDNTVGRDPSSQAAADLELARSISSGDLSAWHKFLESYSGLLYGVIRRRLFAEDEDDVRTVYVDILKALYESDIGKYRGDATLATWLIVYARSRSLDFLRHRYGRRRPPKWYEELGSLDRDVIRLFFVEHLPLDVVAQALAWSGHDVSAEDLVESIQRIESVADAHTLTWIAGEHTARALGVHSPAMLSWMTQARIEYEEKTRRSRPDAAFDEREAAALADRVRRALGRLSSEEREVASRRFEELKTANEIDAELGLGGERRAYTIIARVVRKLRRALLANNEGQL